MRVINVKCICFVCCIEGHVEEHIYKQVSSGELKWMPVFGSITTTQDFETLGSLACWVCINTSDNANA